MKKAILILLLFTCACQKPFEFKNEYWLLERINLDVERQLGVLKINGDTMRNLPTPPDFSEDYYSMMDLTADSLTTFNPCGGDRRKYIVVGEVLLLDSMYRLSPIQIEDITSELFFEGTSLTINLQPFQGFEDKIDKTKGNYCIYIGKYRPTVEKNEANYEFLDASPFFTDDYHLKAHDIFLDSADVKELFEIINSSKESSIVSFYVSKDFGEERKKQFIEYLIENTYKELEIYEGYFSIEQYPFVKHKKYSPTK